jgi:hypothetical protein
MEEHRGEGVLAVARRLVGEAVTLEVDRGRPIPRRAERRQQVSIRKRRHPPPWEEDHRLAVARAALDRSDA